MYLLKSSIILHQFVERDRRIAVDVDAGVEQIVPRLDAGPEIHVRIRVDMSVDHI